jgi:hypothetical protein
VSYIGYSPKDINLDHHSNFHIIFLQPREDILEEVSLSSSTKGLEIIKKTIERKSLNNPQKKLESFEFKAYNRLIISANPD